MHLFGEPPHARTVVTASSLLRYPFRVFFAMTALYAFVLMGGWAAMLFLALPIVPTAPGPVWHGHEMIFGVVPAAIAGFLLTAVATWTASPAITGRPLAWLVAAWLAGRLAMWSTLPPSLVAAIDLTFLPALALCVGKTLARHGDRRNLILIALLVLLALANALVHAELLGVVSSAIAGRNLALDLLTVMMLVVAGRIAPAFTANWLRMHGRDASVVVVSPMLDRVAVGTAALIVPLELVRTLGQVDLGAIVAVVAALAAGANALRLLRWRGWAAADEPLLWILHTGVAWIVIALATKSATIALDLPMTIWIHLLGVGAIGTLVLGVMTRVALGHTGRTLRLPRGALLIYVAILAAAALRTFAALGFALETSLAGSALLWMTAFAVFLLLYGPILARPRVDGRPG